jgi:hypothetical protein
MSITSKPPIDPMIPGWMERERPVQFISMISNTLYNERYRRIVQKKQARVYLASGLYMLFYITIARLLCKSRNPRHKS